MSTATAAARHAGDAPGRPSLLERAVIAIVNLRADHAHSRAQRRADALIVKMSDDGSLAKHSPLRVVYRNL